MVESKNISVIVPVYNGQSSIQELIERLMTVLNNHFDENSELIIVDDNSKDNSWDLIKQQKIKYQGNIIAVRLTRNYGQHNATLCGISHAKNDFVCTIDDDLEFNPEDIQKLLQKQQENNADLVYGIDPKKNKGVLIQVLGTLYRFVVRLLLGKEYLIGSSFRLMKKHLAKDILVHARHFSFIDEFLLWQTSNISTVIIKCEKSKRKKSRYSIFSLFSMVVGLAFISSTLPLRFIKFIGGLLAIFNFIYGVYMIYQRIVFNITVDGYTSILVSVLFSTGIIIFTLGVLAEYISNILKISYNQPVFKEAEIL